MFKLLCLVNGEINRRKKKAILQQIQIKKTLKQKGKYWYIYNCMRAID